MAINRRDIFGEGQDEVFDTSKIGKPFRDGITEPLIKQLARKAGITIPTVANFGLTRQSLQNRRRGIPTPAENFIALINDAVQDVRKLRVDRNRLERQPGLLPQERQAIEADIQRISSGGGRLSGLTALREFSETEGFDLGQTFAPLVREFQSGGIEFSEDEVGNIITQPPSDLITTPPAPPPEGPLTPDELLGEQYQKNQH